MTKLYAGIGSRRAPAEDQYNMLSLAHDLHRHGWGLRTGYSYVDQPFKAGAREYELHRQRNNQILGADLKSPVDMVICWMGNSNTYTRADHATQLAKAHNIPVFDLALEHGLQDIITFLNSNLGELNDETRADQPLWLGHSGRGNPQAGRARKGRPMAGRQMERRALLKGPSAPPLCGAAERLHAALGDTPRSSLTL